MGPEIVAGSISEEIRRTSRKESCPTKRSFRGNTGYLRDGRIIGLVERRKPAGAIPQFPSYAGSSLSLLLTLHCLLLTPSYSLLFTLYCLLPTPYSLLFTVHCSLCFSPPLPHILNHHQLPVLFPVIVHDLAAIEADVEDTRCIQSCKSLRQYLCTVPRQRNSQQLTLTG